MITFATARRAPSTADVVVLAVFSDLADSRPSDLDWASIEARGFEGKSGQVQIVTKQGDSLVAVVGLGEIDSVDTMAVRKAGAAIAKALKKHKTIATPLLEDLPARIERNAAAQALAEGIVLGAYGFERYKSEGAVVIALYGTPQTYALTEKLTEDRIPGTSPGFGRADAADGTRYPYIFPIAATYWSQATAAVHFVKQQLGSLHGKKIAYLFYDNPAGREPLPILEDLATREGFELKTFAVPPPGLEIGAQALDIAHRFHADFVIAHLFGRSPSVSIKELNRVGYPLNKVLSFVWGSAEADIRGAGGFSAADGYYTMQFAGVGSDYPVLRDIRAMYQKAGKQPPSQMASTVYYNRGVLQAALAVQAIRNALQAKAGGEITGEDVKKGFERIKDFTLGGLVPPIAITPENHEGGGWVQIWQVKAGKLTRVTDWFKAYPDVIAQHLKEAHASQS